MNFKQTKIKTINQVCENVYNFTIIKAGFVSGFFVYDIEL